MIAGFMVLTFLTVFNSHPLTFDEVLFPRNVLLMEEVGFGKQFLLEMYDQAPGPLYQFIHYPLKYITNLEPPGIRVVNLVFLVGITVLVYKIGGLIYDDFKLSDSLRIIIVPTIWLITGLALTEIPAIFFMMLSIFFFLLADRKYNHSNLRWMFCILSGICLGFSILGRSPYLMLVIGYLVFLFYDRSLKNVLGILTIVLIGLAMSVPVFVVWGGLVPPAQVSTGEGGISIQHGILGIAYTAITFLIISPYWFKLKKSQLLIFSSIFVICLILNFFVLDPKIGIPALSVTISKIVSEQFATNVYPYVIAAFFITLSLFFAYLCLKTLVENRRDKYFVFVMITAALLIATCFKVTHLFSSRYVAQAAPLFILITYRSSNSVNNNRLILYLFYVLGMCIGIMSLLTYANFTL